MTEIIKTTYQLRRGTEAAWKKNNPVLATGEPGFVIDKNILKIGDGVTPWNDLKEPNSGTSNSGGTGSVYNAKTHYEFPNVGSSEVIYKAEEEKKSIKAKEKLGNRNNHNRNYFSRHFLIRIGASD